MVTKREAGNQSSYMYICIRMYTYIHIHIHVYVYKIMYKQEKEKRNVDTKLEERELKYHCVLNFINRTIFIEVCPHTFGLMYLSLFLSAAGDDSEHFVSCE